MECEGDWIAQSLECSAEGLGPSPRGAGEPRRGREQELGKVSKELVEKSEAARQEEQQRKALEAKAAAVEKQVLQLQVRGGGPLVPLHPAHQASPPGPSGHPGSSVLSCDCGRQRPRQGWDWNPQPWSCYW